MPPPALLKGAYGSQEVYLAEGRPEDVGEIELAIGALPQEKARKADLAACPDDQVGIRQIGRIEIAADRLGRDQFHRLSERPAASLLVAQVGLDSVGDFLASAVGGGDGEMQLAVGAGGRLG